MTRCEITTNMSQVRPELYDIFSYVFDLLRKPGSPRSRAEISSEVIKFLEILKNQELEQTNEFTRDFFAWLSLQILNIIYDKDLQDTASAILDGFLEILEIRACRDPLILTGILNIFIESLENSLGPKLFNKGQKEPIFSINRLDVDNELKCNETKIVVDNASGIQPTYLFFVAIVDRCANIIIELDQTYTFDILDVILKLYEFCNEDLKLNVLNLISHLIVTTQPTNSYEWDQIYTAFYVYFTISKQPNLLKVSHYESLYKSIYHIVTETSGFDMSLAELMFALSVESPFAIETALTSGWAKLSVQILNKLDLGKLDLEAAMTKLVSFECWEFVPLIESYIAKNAEMVAYHESLKCVLEQKSSVWKSCLNVMARVPFVSYSASSFGQLLDFSVAVISAGRRLAYFLKFRFKNIDFELLGPRCLKALSAVPFMCHECLSDFCPTKCQSLVSYISAMFGLFAEIESCKIEDTHLIEHVLVILTVPWNQRCAEEMPLELQLACLGGLANLLFVLTSEKCRTPVSLLLTIFTKIKGSDHTVQKKYLCTVILALFKAPDDQVGELISIFKHYLMPENFEHLLYNQFIDFKLPCLLANRCIVHNTAEGWKLVCSDCDACAGEPVMFALQEFTEYAALQFLDCLGSYERLTTNCISRFISHSAKLRSPEAVRKIILSYLKSNVNDRVSLNEVILRLAYSDSDVNEELIAAMYGAICTALKRSVHSGLNHSVNSLAPLMEITKILFRLDFPSSMSIFKILMIYYLSAGVSVCGIRGLFKSALTARKSDVPTFCKSYEPQLGKFIVDFIFYKAHVEEQQVYISFVQIMNILGYKTDVTFVSSGLMASVLAEIVKTSDVTISLHIISEIARLFLLDVKGLIVQHYDHIFTEIYSLEDEKIPLQHLLPLLEHCGIDLETSLHKSYSQLVCKLILNSKHPLKIFRFLFQSKEIDTENFESQLNVLKQHFIGCLTVIESTLTSSSATSLHTAKNYIKCISTFTKILGLKIVREIQAKLLTTLRTCLPHFYDTFPKHCLAAWRNFCYSINPKKIGPYLPTIFVHLLPLVEKFPNFVSDIFYYFVVENGHNFREQLPLLHFVPSGQNIKMQQVWCVVQSSLLNTSHQHRNIAATLENIYSECTETKIIALEHLKICLKDQAVSWTESLSSNEAVDPIFESILTCLLDNITHKNNDVKTLCGECLGELGAIDPKKFGFNDAHKSYSPQKYDLTADDFSVLCITKIVHCLGKYEDSRTTVVLYSTIQELLRLQLMEKTEMDVFKYFSKFSQQDQFVLQPLLQTKYIFRGFKIERNFSNPISYGYHTSKTPCEWATIWASQILARMPASFAKSVFSTCLPAMQINMEVMETVLPYILLHALVTCNDTDLDLIEQEMKYILHWDLSKHRTKPDNLMMIVGGSARSVIHSDVSQTKYVGIILDLLDFVNQAVSDFYFFEATMGLSSEEAVESKIQSFVQRFSPNAMSWKSFIQEDPCRSLYYIEKGCVDEKEIGSLKPLRNIYSKLNHIDGLVGVVKSSTQPPTAEETVVNHIVYGSVQDGLSWFETLGSKYQSTVTYRGLIQCYLEINQPSTALAISTHIINYDKYLKPDIFSEHIEALWNAGRFTETDNVFNELDSKFVNGHSWSMDVVGINRLLRKPEYTNIMDKIKSIRLDVVNRLCDLDRTGMNLYRQGYWYMVKLHVLNDIETFTDILFGLPPNGSTVDGFKQAWDRFDKRVSVLPPHGPYIQDVRKSHLQTLDVVLDASREKMCETGIVNFSNRLGTMWLDSAKKSRKNKCFQDAYTCIGIAQRYSPPKLFIELAKYYQAKFDTDSAVMVLQQGLNENPSLVSASSDLEACTIFAKAKLLAALFNVNSMNFDFNDGYTALKEATEICNMEKSFVCLASYLYHQHLSEAEPDNTTAKRYIQVDAARNFGKSLLYGSKHIYQSMPSMLSIWLDYGARVAKKLPTMKRGEESGILKTLKDFNSLMENNLSCLPSYMFMTAFSQILSRINHRQQSCFEILKSIIIQIIQDYPQQSMWSFIAVCRSNNAMQKRRTEEVCKKIKSANKDLAKFFKIFVEFTEKLIEIALKKIKYSKEVKLTQLSPQLKPLIAGYYRSVPIMLPLQKLLTVHIGTGKSGDRHVPFPLAPIYITDVKENVLVLFSVQMPKRLEFIGSDGEVYPLLCKKDDLRLDSRIMEFNSVINSLLRMDSVAKEKDLSIRTYSVVPLNSECGIIEWLSGLLSLKGIISDMYTKLGVPPMPMSQIKKLMLVSKDECDLSERLRRFVDIIVPKHPPVLHKWFFDRHPCPDAWYHCRNAFVKSSAVMSIVGYVVGLGDRHGENILIDSKTGEAVHVDFNCLFNRADLLQYPETVPFRLTHSMVRAMGATGVDGLFVTSCEVTNRVMRHHSEQLLSIMKPFLYDMDVKPNAMRKSSSSVTTDDQANEEARTNIKNIEMRLNGVVRSKSDQYAPHRNSKPLSVEGQTRMLIKEASSELNLCQMFAGWAPYM